MTKPFPSSQTFSDFDWPVRADADVFDLEVIGEIPKELNGTFYRCGPEHQYPPWRGDDVFINGDGVISMFRIEDGHVDFKTRFVHTERFNAERAARRSLFGEYRNPYTNDPSVEGVDMGTANTTALFHAGKLFALKEDSLPMLIDPDTLETKGRWNFDGKLASKTMTAHPEIDPVTGEMICYGPAGRGGVDAEISYFVVGKDGQITKELWITPPYAAMMHDVAVTREHVIFPIMPTTPDDARMRAGGPIFQWDDSLPSYLGVMRRDGDGSDIRWFKGPAMWMYHVMNAWTEGRKIYIDCCISDIQSFPFFSDIRGRPYDGEKARPHLKRWTIDLDGPDEFATTETFGLQCEYPRTDDRAQMGPYKTGYICFTDPERSHEVTTRRSGETFNTVGRFDMEQRKIVDRFYAGERSVPQESQFAPRRPGSGEADGFLLTVVNRYEDYRSDLVILDALNLSAGPLAICRLPLRSRAAFHGCWVPAETLAAAR